MPVIVSLLRAVNLGPYNKLNMAELRALYASLGFRNPQTYLQSGNVVFSTTSKSLDRIKNQIEDAIETQFGFRCDVILRTTADLRSAVKANPFAGRQDIHPGRLLVSFLARPAGANAMDALEALRLTKKFPEEFHLRGQQLYIHYCNGAGRSKLTGAVLDKALQTPGTARNWNTVTNLLRIAEEME